MIVAFEFFDDMCEVDQCCCMCIKRLYEVFDGVCVSCVCVSLCVRNYPLYGPNPCVKHGRVFIHDVLRLSTY